MKVPPKLATNSGFVLDAPQRPAELTQRNDLILLFFAQDIAHIHGAILCRLNVQSPLSLVGFHAIIIGRTWCSPRGKAQVLVKKFLLEARGTGTEGISNEGPYNPFAGHRGALETSRPADFVSRNGCVAPESILPWLHQCPACRLATRHCRECDLRHAPAGQDLGAGMPDCITRSLRTEFLRSFNRLRMQ